MYSALTVNFGVASSVSELARICFIAVPLSSYTLKLGLSGGVSFVPLISRATELLPEASIADTEALSLTVKAGEIVIVNFPSASATPLPITLVPIVICIFALASAVPVTVVPSALIWAVGLSGAIVS